MFIYSIHIPYKHALKKREKEIKRSREDKEERKKL